MPRVPTYQPFQQTPTPASTTTFQGPTGPAPGQIAGQQLQKVGASIGQAGDQLGAFARAQQDQINRARFYDVQTQIRRELSQQENSITLRKGSSLFEGDHLPEGKNAFDVAEEELNAWRDTTRGRLNNPALQRMFDQEYNRQFGAWNDKMITYQSEQGQLYYAQSRDAAEIGYYQDADANPAARDENFYEAITMSRQNGIDAGLSGNALDVVTTQRVSEQIDALLQTYRDEEDFQNGLALLESETLVNFFGAMGRPEILEQYRYDLQKGEATLRSAQLSIEGDLTSAMELIDEYDDALSDAHIFELQQSAIENYAVWERRNKEDDDDEMRRIEQYLNQEVTNKRISVEELSRYSGLIKPGPYRALLKLVQEYTEPEPFDLETESTYSRIELAEQFGKVPNEEWQDEVDARYSNGRLTRADYLALVDPETGYIAVAADQRYKGVIMEIKARFTDARDENGFLESPASRNAEATIISSVTEQWPEISQLAREEQDARIDSIVNRAGDLVTARFDLPNYPEEYPEWIDGKRNRRPTSETREDWEDLIDDLENEMAAEGVTESRMTEIERQIEEINAWLLVTPKAIERN